MPGGVSAARTASGGTCARPGDRAAQQGRRADGQPRPAGVRAAGRLVVAPVQRQLARQRHPPLVVEQVVDR